jgi:diketogulonate reductase-like aldo/keto reductase
MDMERRSFGALGRDVSVVGQGTWLLDAGDRAAAVAALRLGLDRGMTHIDSAEQYGMGVVEEIVREAITGRRDEVFLVSKLLADHASRKIMVTACEDSLARLGTDRLDVYVLEGRGRFPLEDTIEGFKQLRRDGKIRAWGVSNFDAPDLQAAMKIARAETFVCNQVLYNLTQRAIEHAVLPWCEAEGVAVVGYAPLGHGLFPRPGTVGGRVLQEIAAAHDATPRQVALRFLLRFPALFTIPKAARPEHVIENSVAGDPELRLTEAEILRIDEAFPLGPRPAVLPML